MSCCAARASSANIPPPPARPLSCSRLAEAEKTNREKNTHGVERVLYDVSTELGTLGRALQDFTFGGRKQGGGLLCGLLPRGAALLPRAAGPT
jgi:hypothetical protein